MYVGRKLVSEKFIDYCGGCIVNDVYMLKFFCCDVLFLFIYY